ncbi:hypothetical protein [Amycolatopsis magusensis]|uniref:hypothetical protein n=1 Tax=Amycolatopsis magusensis TaxID=882444 RepID=UPI003C2B1C31
MTSPPRRHRPARTLHRRTHGPLPASRDWHRAAANRGLRPATLWPFADAEPLPGTARLAGWLGHAIITLVTTYTHPGDRVLLLTPPAPTRPRREQPYAGLAEAVWNVARLGRGADTATAAAAPDHAPGLADPSRVTGAESASRRRLSRPGQAATSESAAESARSPQRADRRPGDRFALIITAVCPDSTDWLSHTDWNTLIAHRGLIAVLTHGHQDGSRLQRPQPPVVNTLGDGGFRVLDHIAVLDAPLARSGRIHHDLFLLSRSTNDELGNKAAGRTENPHD